MSYPKGVELCDTHRLSLKLRGVSAARGRVWWLTKKGSERRCQGQQGWDDQGVFTRISQVPEDHLFSLSIAVSVPTQQCMYMYIHVYMYIY